MYFVGFKIFIFILLHHTIASKYYYKKKDGTYDIYYGPRPIWGYKEFKSPKSYKIQHGDRGDRPGNCSTPDFLCKEPYQVKETEVFECDVDYQCPSYFKCCQVHCFQHKICQPAILDDDKSNEIPIYDVDMETFTKTPPTKQFTLISPSFPIQTTSANVETTSLNVETTTILETKEPVTYTTELPSSAESIKSSLTAEVTSLTTEKPSTASTEKSSETSNIPLKTTENPTTSLKPQIISKQPENEGSTSKQNTATKTSIKPHITTTIDIDGKPTTNSVLSTTVNAITIQETTSRFTVKQSETQFTPTKSSSATNNANTNDDIITDDEDLTFSGDNELDESTLDETVYRSTATMRTTNIPITSSSLKTEVTRTAKSSENTKESTLLAKSSTGEEKTTAGISEISTQQFSTVQSLTPTKRREEQTTFSVSTLQFSTKLNEAQTESTIVSSGTTPLTTRELIKLSTQASQKKTTVIADVTDDDEDLTFSGDYEVSTDISTLAHKSSTVQEVTTNALSNAAASSTKFSVGDKGTSSSDGISTKAANTNTVSFESSTESESTKTQLETSVESFTTTPKLTLTTKYPSTSLTTIKAVASSKSTSTAIINTDTVTDDEDLSFSGDGELDTDVVDRTTSTLNSAPTSTAAKVSSIKLEVTTESTIAGNSQKPSSRHTSTTESNSIEDNEDLVFSGEGQVKTTAEIPQGSVSFKDLESVTKTTISQTSISTGELQKGTDNDDFSFSDNVQSTKISETTGNKQSTAELTTKGFNSELSNSQMTSTYTKLTSNTLPQREVDDLTKPNTKENSGVTTKGSSDDINLLTGQPYSTIITTTEMTTNKDRLSSNDDVSGHTASVPFGTETTSKLVTNTEGDLVASATIKTESNEANLPLGTGIVFTNGLLGVLRELPKIAIVETSNNFEEDHYFNNFLALIGKVPYLIKEADVDNNLLNDGSKEHSTQYQTTTEVN